MAFSLEEKVDLLLKKVAFGKAKTNTSENTDGFGESIASPLLLRGDKVMKQSASIPSTPGAVTNIVQAHQGADVVECTAATGTTDTNITGFKRAWSTGQQNWIPSEFSAAYTVEVYVGPSGWNGTDAIATTIGGTNGTSTGASVFRVVPGVETANWFFDYQAGVLYWTNEDEDGAVGGSTELTSSIHINDVVYIKGYKYIGDFGVGGTSDITGGASTIATDDLTDDRALISNDSGKVVVSDVTATELSYLDGVTQNIQDQLNGIQTDVDGNESDADTAIAAVASDLSAYETSNDTAVAAKLALAGGDMTGNIVFDSGQPKGNAGLVPAAGNAGEFLKHNGTFGVPSYTAAPTLSDINGLSITAVGALNSGSIASGFGNIDNGDSTLDTGAATVASLTIGGHLIDDIDITGEFVDADAHIMSSKAIGARFALKDADTAGSAADIAGGTLGSVPYQSGADTTAFLAGNTAATNLFMRSVGDGANAAAPTFAAVTKTDVGLSLVENTAISSFVGTTNITTLGTISTGVWEGTAIAIDHGGTGQTTAVAAFNALANIDHGGDFTIGTQANDTANFTGHGSFGGDLTVAGNLNVIGTGTYINLQQENVYMKDALVTLGFVDDDDNPDSDFSDGTAAGSNVGIEAYKQGVSNTSPTLVYSISSDYWAIDNKDHASSALTRVARTFKIAHTITTAQISAGFFTVTHNLNHEDLIVQVRDNSTDQEVIFFKYKTKTAQTVQIFVGSNFSNGDVVNVVVVG